MTAASRTALTSSALPDGLAACPLCGASAHRDLTTVHDPISLQPFSVYRCAACRLAITHPKPKDLAPFYATRYYGNRHSLTSRFRIWRRMRVVNRTCANTNRSLLDVGCGDAQFAVAARRAGWSVTATEMNRTAAEAQGIRVFASLQDVTGRYRCITMWHVLEHIPDPRAAIMRVRQLIEEDGELLLSVPNYSSWQSMLFGKHWFHLDVPRHCHHFDRTSLRALLEANAFIIDSEYQETEYDWFGWIQSAINPFTSTPSVVFDWLIGNPRRVSKTELFGSLLAAALLAPAAFLLTVASRLARRSGTIVIAARPGTNHVV